jgi:pantothenate kinase-related protein Tda10
LEEVKYLEWGQPTDSESHILRLSGGAGTGKSVITILLQSDLKKRSVY